MTPGAYRTTAPTGGYNAFVTKIDPSGTNLVYSTYLGPGFGNCIVVDTAGNAYVTFSGSVIKINPTGSSLVYSTHINGVGFFTGIALDSSGNAYVTGVTYSTNFPTTPGAYQTIAPSGAYNAFVTKINSTGSSLVYSTYLGGSDFDLGLNIAVNGSGNAVVVGQTETG